MNRLKSSLIAFVYERLAVAVEALICEDGVVLDFGGLLL